MNIDKYLNNITQTSDGYVYKNQDAFEKKEGICYIPECGIDILRQSKEEGCDLTDEEIISEGIASTYDTIIGECEDAILRINRDKIKKMARRAFDNVTWEFICTEIEQMLIDGIEE